MVESFECAFKTAKNDDWTQNTKPWSFICKTIAKICQTIKMRNEPERSKFVLQNWTYQTKIVYWFKYCSSSAIVLPIFIPLSLSLLHQSSTNIRIFQKNKPQTRQLNKSIFSFSALLLLRSICTIIFSNLFFFCAVLNLRT